MMRASDAFHGVSCSRLQCICCSACQRRNVGLRQSSRVVQLAPQENGSLFAASPKASTLNSRL